MENIPDLTGQGIELPNGYGYACSCMKVGLDKHEEHITEIISVKVLPIARCNADPHLKHRPATLKAYMKSLKLDENK